MSLTPCGPAFAGASTNRAQRVCFLLDRAAQTADRGAPMQVSTQQTASPAADVAFEVHTRSSLPRLSWCLELADSATLARIYHGAWVETGSDAFFEGAWAGDYSRADFDQHFMTGTG